MAIKYVNNLKVGLANPVGIADTQITVTDTSAFPTLGPSDVMYLTLSDQANISTEIVRCTAVDTSTNVITVVRGYDGSTAQAWTADDNISSRLTAGMLNELLANQTTVDNANWSGADLTIEHGGTGASSASAARNNLGLEIGVNVLSPTGDGSQLTGIEALPDQTGHAGQVLVTDGTTADWADPQPSEVTMHSYEYTATSNQTTFSGVDLDGNTLSYTPSNLRVYMDGAQLSTSEYTATDGTSVVLITAATGGEDIVIVAFESFVVADTYSKSESDAKYLNKTTGGTMTGDIAHGDNVKSKYGASDDLQIYHDGINSVVRDAGTGELRLAGTNLRLTNSDQTKTYLSGTDGGDTRLAYDNAYKLFTTSTGVDVTGTVSADGLGIGTSSPAAQAHIAGASNGTLRVDTTASGYLDLSMYSNGAFLGTSAAQPLRLGVSGVEKARIDSSGKVGIGTSSPSAALDVVGEGIVGNGTYGVKLSYSVGSTAGVIDTADSANTLSLRTSGTERARIDSSGNQIWGKTTTSFSTEGAYIGQNGKLVATRANGSLQALNRTGSDGPISEFYKDGTTVGSIGVALSDNLYFATSASGIACGTAAMYPASSTGQSSDNDTDLGTASTRWDDVYATNGTIQTSDRNEKQDIQAITEAESRVAQACKGLMRSFRWKDAVEKKGDDARIHFGIIAQDLQAAFEAEGLDAGRYAMFISPTWYEKEITVDAVAAQDAVYETITVDAVLDDEGNEVEAAYTYENLVSEAVEAKDAYSYMDTKDEPTEGYTERTRLGVRYPELLAFIIAAS